MSAVLAAGSGRVGSHSWWLNVEPKKADPEEVMVGMARLKRLGEQEMGIPGKVNLRFTGTVEFGDLGLI